MNTAMSCGFDLDSARGEKQKPEVDFYSMDIYSPVARMTSFRLFVALCNLLALNPFQCDVDTAYLNAALHITHYIRHIAGFPLNKGWIYKVKHAMYGLHQSGQRVVRGTKLLAEHV